MAPPTAAKTPSRDDRLDAAGLAGCVVCVLHMALLSAALGDGEASSLRGDRRCMVARLFLSSGMIVWIVNTDSSRRVD
jgi:hypothetical protein